MSTTSSTKPTPPPHETPTTRLNEGTAKEARAHEHARHRTKERQGYALAKERKQKAATVRVLGLKVTHTHGARLVRRLSMESWDGDEPEKRSVRDAVPKTPVAEPEPKPAPEYGHGRERDVAPPRENTGSFTELTLEDVISQPRRAKAKPFDFEVIPPIRAVIALDDAETDEPWEYITRASVNDGSAWKGKSYAQAVASAM